MRITNLRARLKKLITGPRQGRKLKHRLTAAVVTGGMLFSGATANAEDVVLNGGFETPDTGWTNQGGDYTHPYGGLNGPQLTAVGTLTDYGFFDNISADAGLAFHGLALPSTQTVNLVNADLTAQQILDGEGRFSFSAWMATCCGDNPKVTATFDVGGSTSLNRGIVDHLQTTADILVNPGGGDNTESMGVATDASRRYWALYEFKGNIPNGATTVTIAVDDGRADAGIGSGNGNDNYADMVIFDAVFDPTFIPDLAIKLSIDLDNGQMSLINNTGASQQIKGYSILSDTGALDETSATFLSGGDADWIQLSANGATGDLSEGHLSTDTFATGTVHSFGNGSWAKYFGGDDISFQYLDGTGALVNGLIEYTGTTQISPFEKGDLDFDGDIDRDDWLEYVGGLQTDLSSMSVAQAYTDGDLNGDLVNNHADFTEFKSLFETANPLQSFEAMVAGVPEPTSVVLAIFGLVGLVSATGRCRELT